MLSPNLNPDSSPLRHAMAVATSSDEGRTQPIRPTSEKKSLPIANAVELGLNLSPRLMHFLDWIIVIVPLICIFLITRATARYNRSVAGFLSAERCAGRYLICNARGEAGHGAISAVAVFQVIYTSGLTLNWWSQLSMTAGLFIALTGFVIYRYRETRVLTLAQFFEVRYSKRFRIFTGFIAFLSGVVNYGIFPGSARGFLFTCAAFLKHCQSWEETFPLMCP